MQPQVPNRGLQLEASVIFFLALAWITVIVRCYVRIFMIKCFAIDDYLILVTLGFFTVFGGLAYDAVQWGIGRHNADVSIPDQTKAFQLWFFAELSYILTTVFLRLAVGHFLLRVAIHKRHRYTIHFLNTVNVLFNVAYFFFQIFTCHPISYFWTRVNQEHNGRCLNLASAYVTVAQSVLSILLDWTYGILPIFIVRGLNMTKKKKLLVAMILSLGALYVRQRNERGSVILTSHRASTAPIVRLPYLYLIAHRDDFLWYALPVAVWSYLEPGVGITAVSLATLRPLFHSFLVRIGLSTGNSTAQRYKLSNNQSRPRLPLRSSSGGASSTIKKAYIRHDGDLFVEDEELQLRGMAPRMGNTSHVEAGLQRAPRGSALGDWSPPESRGEKEGIRTTWVKGDSENNSLTISEDEIATIPV